MDKLNDKPSTMNTPEIAPACSISVAMATCNGLPWLPQQLESILAQTLAATEIVISDDASNDGSWAYLIDQAAQHPQLRLLRNSTRIGTARNFECAIRACKGDLIFLSDQDDLWCPHKIERQAADLLNSGSLLAMSDGELISAVGEPLGQTLWQANGLTGPLLDALSCGRAANELIAPRYVTGCAIAFRAELRRWLLPIPVGTWHDAWIGFTAAVVGEGHISLIHEKLFHYRQHGANQLGAKVAPRWWQPQKFRAYLSRLHRDIGSIQDLQDHVLFVAAARSWLDTEGLPIKSNDKLRRHLDLHAQFYEFRLAFAAAANARPNLALSTILRGYRDYASGWRSAARDGISHLSRRIRGLQRRA